MLSYLKGNNKEVSFLQLTTQKIADDPFDEVDINDKEKLSAGLRAGVLTGLGRLLD